MGSTSGNDSSCISRNSFIGKFTVADKVRNIENKLPNRRKSNLSQTRTSNNGLWNKRCTLQSCQPNLTQTRRTTARRPETRLSSDRPSMCGDASPQPTVRRHDDVAAGRCATISVVGRYLTHTESTRLKISQRIEPLPLLDNIPFVVCMSTGQTHNIGLTVQQSLSLMKLPTAYWPFNCTVEMLTNRQRPPRTRRDDGGGGEAYRPADIDTPHRLSEIAENECGVDKLSAVRYAKKCRRINRLTAKINVAIQRYAGLTESLKYSLKINDLRFLREVEKKILSQESVIKNRLETVREVLCKDDYDEESVVERPTNQIDTLQLLKKLKRAKVVENIFLTS